MMKILLVIIVAGIWGYFTPYWAGDYYLIPSILGGIGIGMFFAMMD